MLDGARNEVGHQWFSSTLDKRNRDRRIRNPGGTRGSYRGRCTVKTSSPHRRRRSPGPHDRGRHDRGSRVRSSGGHECRRGDPPAGARRDISVVLTDIEMPGRRTASGSPRPSEVDGRPSKSSRHRAVALYVKAICRRAGCSWQNRTAPTRFPAPCGISRPRPRTGRWSTPPCKRHGRGETSGAKRNDITGRMEREPHRSASSLEKCAGGQFLHCQGHQDIRLAAALGNVLFAIGFRGRQLCSGECSDGPSV
jgi:hypothetical protein